MDVAHPADTTSPPPPIWCWPHPKIIVTGTSGVIMLTVNARGLLEKVGGDGIGDRPAPHGYRIASGATLPEERAIFRG